MRKRDAEEIPKHDPESDSEIGPENGPQQSDPFTKLEGVLPYCELSEISKKTGRYSRMEPRILPHTYFEHSNEHPDEQHLDLSTENITVVCSLVTPQEVIPMEDSSDNGYEKVGMRRVKLRGDAPDSPFSARRSTSFGRSRRYRRFRMHPSTDIPFRLVRKGRQSRRNYRVQRSRLWRQSHCGCQG
jgi:hypothetical protein